MSEVDHVAKQILRLIIDLVSIYRLLVIKPTYKSPHCLSTTSSNYRLLITKPLKHDFSNFRVARECH